MKWIILLVLLTGCARVTVTTEDPSGRNWDITSTTLGKDITGVEAAVGDVNFSLGESKSSPENRAIACTLAPELCK